MEPIDELPTITYSGVLDMRVCVPEGWDDDQVTAYANEARLCGTTHGWGIRRKGSDLLAGCKERVPCEKRKGFVHIMLDA